PFVVFGIQVVSGFDKKSEKTLEVFDTQATIGLDQLVQRWRGLVSRFRLEKQLDRFVADLFADHLLLVFAHGFSGPTGPYGGGSLLREAGALNATCAVATKVVRENPRFVTDAALGQASPSSCVLILAFCVQGVSAMNVPPLFAAWR